jgi:hypothetical protein
MARPASAGKIWRGTDRGAQGDRTHDRVRVGFGTDQVAEVVKSSGDAEKLPDPPPYSIAVWMLWC